VTILEWRSAGPGAVGRCTELHGFSAPAVEPVDEVAIIGRIQAHDLPCLAAS
jgi:hypothetical protein